MPPLWLTLLVVLFAAHCFADGFGLTVGEQVRWLFRPAVWLIYGVTLGRVDLRKCKACKEREAYLNEVFGSHPKEHK